MSSWRPKPWIAGILGWITFPLGMLYVHRWGLAIIYFCTMVAIVLGEYILNAKGVVTSLYIFSLSLLFAMICGIHAFSIAKHQMPLNKRRWYSRWYGLAIVMVVFVLCVLLFRSFLFEPFRMPSGSMLPTLKVDSYVVVKKWGYGYYGTLGISLHRTQVQPAHQPKRGDLVIFEYPPARSIKFVKRVIGLPGDTIKYENKRLYVNDIEYSQQEVSTSTDAITFTESVRNPEGDTDYQILIDPRRASQDITVKVPESQYFMMGDNRDNSNDSRGWGFVPESHLIGKVIYILQ